MKKVDCTVIGDAMIDVFLPLADVHDVHSLSLGGVTNTKMVLSPGGSANVAFFISKLGGSSAFVGKVGDDYFGRMFLDDLQEHGVTTNTSVSKGENTGVVFVLVFPNGERFFIDDRGANAKLRYEDLDLDLIRDSKYLFFSGYSFQDRGILDCIQRLFREVAGDTSVVFNPGAPNLAKEFRDSFIDTIRKYVSFLVLNEAEAQYLTGNVSEKEILASLLSMADTVALTKGDRGSIIARQDEICEFAACPTMVLDTTGAGDAYAGGAIYGLCRGWDTRTTGRLASEVAARVVCQVGTRVDLSGLLS